MSQLESLFWSVKVDFYFTNSIWLQIGWNNYQISSVIPKFSFSYYDRDFDRELNGFPRN